MPGCIQYASVYSVCQGVFSMPACIQYASLNVRRKCVLTLRIHYHCGFKVDPLVIGHDRFVFFDKHKISFIFDILKSETCDVRVVNN